MCGIAGILDIGHKGLCTTPNMEAMALAMKHRGPDDQGVWCDGPIGLAHTRLAVIDLSRNGRQPMTSSDGRYVIVYNGEVYNHQDLRTEFFAETKPWRGRSDTETVLELIGKLGVVKALEYCNGMFALAIWDRHKCTLHIARDRMGIKPLYYGWSGNTFVFASQLSAISSLPFFESEINRDALALFLRFNFVPAPYSIYAGLNKLMPGTVATIPFSGGKHTSTETQFWDLSSVLAEGAAAPVGSLEDALNLLDQLLKEAVKLRMLSDVPLGTFLSGGIDSSIVTALLQAQCSRQIRSFTVAFDDQAFDESAHARAVSDHLGSDHLELHVTPAMALDTVPRLASVFDEPFSDSSQIPMLLLAALTRQHVTVALSGDGGDELFGGYSWYQDIARRWRIMRVMPPAMRRFCATFLNTLNATTLNAHKANSLAQMLCCRSGRELYRWYVSHWRDPSRIVLRSREPEDRFSLPGSCPSLGSLEQLLMFLDMSTYLPDDILVKVDRASMAHSLEVRVPLLDHNVVAFASSLPLGAKIRDGNGKLLLRELLYRYIPKHLVDRPKKGFSVPLARWLRHDLRDWAESLLAQNVLVQDGYLDPKPIRAMWEQHIRGDCNRAFLIWDILMFQSWLRSHN